MQRDCLYSPLPHTHTYCSISMGAQWQLNPLSLHVTDCLCCMMGKGEMPAVKRSEAFLHQVGIDRQWLPMMPDGAVPGAVILSTPASGTHCCSAEYPET